MDARNSKSFPILTTERLTLRQLVNSDVPEIFRLRSDITVNKYLGRPLSKTLQEALEFIEKIKNNSVSYWAISINGREKLVGTICLFDISEEQKQGEIGYELLTEYQGKGIMREAAKKVIEYATQNLGMKTILAYPHKDNKSSIKLLEELNFFMVKNEEEGNPDLVLFKFKRD